SSAPVEALGIPTNDMATLENMESSVVGMMRESPIRELAFLDVCYEIEVKTARQKGKNANRNAREKKIVLSHVTGVARHREMMALMGPSGSGKTSLLNVLAQRVNRAAVAGGVYVDGKPLAKAFKRQMGFVFQDELMLWNLTVRETVLFAAKLRLPQSMPEEQKAQRVDDLVKLLGLTHVANTIIGKEARRGVSGGERKRAAIGVEMVTMP
ncbi:unnamed protein product, partial [Phaeothamnion confervicola]